MVMRKVKRASNRRFVEKLYELYGKMNYFELLKIAEQRGIIIKNGIKKDKLIYLLERE